MNFFPVELADIVNESRPAVVFCNAYGVGTERMSRLLDGITVEPVLKMSTATCERFTEYADVVNTENSFVRPKVPANKNNPIAILYTNGTTGVRKGVHLSDSAVKSCVANLMCVNTNFQRFSRCRMKVSIAFLRFTEIVPIDNILFIDRRV